MSGRQLIRMRGIVKRFYIGQPNELEILHGIDLDVNEGEFVSIVGASGSGKSTLMNMIGVLDRPTEGTYWLDGTDVEDAADDELSAFALVVFKIAHHRLLNAVERKQPAGIARILRRDEIHLRENFFCTF